ncbi:MinD-like ATPase involved in chromosome partitioning or flagellar assembly [Georgenia soli]|uniref:MinD-like ATPase involved in chromosome partitioning or flagellar assembly n=1 Tax=Georgenia soli TaxID=638953 RepID=A0A2A9EP06_9MICO|nr:hypothetical protein [Georgenia soli]PFG40648.1 MinD-like ATPase involved in chromosome partitioning or flagellar assembly [Georgenia soli]
MSVGVLIALDGAVESEVVRLLDAPGSGVRVVRRCADVPEVLAAAAAGLGRIAVLDAELPGVDLAVVSRLRAAGVRTLIVTAPDQAERCRSLGPDVVEPAGGPTALADAVVSLARRGDAPHDGEAANGPPAADKADRRAAARSAQTAAGVGVASGESGTAADVSARREHAVPAPGSTPDGPLPEGLLRDAPPPGRRGSADESGTGAPGAVADEHRPGRLVVVWGPPGAPGRTTLAVTLAAELAALAGTVNLIDADTEAPSVTQVLGILDDASAVAAVARQALNGRLDPTVLRRLCPVVDGNIHVMTGLTRADRWRELPSAALEVVWDVARASAPWTVVDTGATLDGDPDGSYGPRRHEATASALAAADVVVVVGAGEPVGMRRLVMALGELADAELLGPGTTRTVVVNRVRASAAGPSPSRSVHEALARFAGVGDAVLVPDDRPALDRAFLQGRTLTQVAPASPARRAVQELAHRLAGERPRRARRRGVGALLRAR